MNPSYTPAVGATEGAPRQGSVRIPHNSRQGESSRQTQISVCRAHVRVCVFRWLHVCFFCADQSVVLHVIHHVLCDSFSCDIHVIFFILVHVLMLGSLIRLSMFCVFFTGTLMFCDSFSCDIHVIFILVHVLMLGSLHILCRDIFFIKPGWMLYVY